MNDTTQSAAAGSSVAGAPLSPYCGSIRSKKYFFLQGLPTEESHLLDGSNHCWCDRTMQGVGPDGELVQPRDCVPGRTCYRSAFVEPGDA